MSYSLNSLTGGYIVDYKREFCRGYSGGGTRSLDYSSNKEFRIWGSRFRVQDLGLRI